MKKQLMVGQRSIGIMGDPIGCNIRGNELHVGDIVLWKRKSSDMNCNPYYGLDVIAYDNHGAWIMGWCGTGMTSNSCYTVEKLMIPYDKVTNEVLKSLNYKDVRTEELPTEVSMEEALRILEEHFEGKVVIKQSSTDWRID